MKRFILVLVIGIFFSTTMEEAWGQTPLKFTEVVKVDSTLKKADLFTAARAWVNKEFVSGKDVTQIADKESGEISVKAGMTYTTKYLSGSAGVCGMIWFMVNIHLKDGKYKYEFTDFEHKGEGSYVSGYGRASSVSLGLITTDLEYPYSIPLLGSKAWYTKHWDEIKAQINATIPGMISRLKAAMALKAVKANSDW